MHRKMGTVNEALAKTFTISRINVEKLQLSECVEWYKWPH